KFKPPMEPLAAHGKTLPWKFSPTDMPDGTSTHTAAWEQPSTTLTLQAPWLVLRLIRATQQLARTPHFWLCPRPNSRTKMRPQLVRKYTRMRLFALNEFEITHPTG